MMKFTMMLLLLCVSTASLMGMEKNGVKESLHFILNGARSIKACSTQNMTYYAPPGDFLGKNILDVVPLDDEDRKLLNNGFEKAVKDKITMRVPYAIKNEQFVAT